MRVFTLAALIPPPPISHPWHHGLFASKPGAVPETITDDIADTRIFGDGDGTFFAVANELYAMPR